MKISYALTVCNEIDEIKRLLTFLIDNKREQDEIVILIDESNGTKEVKDYIEDTAHSSEEDIGVWYYKLNNDFSSFKNFLNSKCTGDYIYQIDADEMVSTYILDVLPEILQHNDIDVIQVPRINTVEGLTQEHIQKWGWRVNDKGWVNFPDFQMRIYRNNNNIKWKNKVHEVLGGYKTMSYLPLEEEWCLLHPKTIERQVKQNNYYNTL